ncbi:hypothetical protein TMatcc_011233 [Talaromyces marneffei ATCC 18224]
MDSGFSAIGLCTEHEQISDIRLLSICYFIWGFPVQGLGWGPVNGTVIYNSVWRPLHQVLNASPLSEDSPSVWTTSTCVLKRGIGAGLCVPFHEVKAPIPFDIAQIRFSAFAPESPILSVVQDPISLKKAHGYKDEPKPLRNRVNRAENGRCAVLYASAKRLIL